MGPAGETVGTVSGRSRAAAIVVVASLVAGLSIATAGSSAAPKPDSGSHLFVVGDAPEQVAALESSSARIVARYETFSLAEADGEDADALAQAGAELRDDMRTLTAGGETFDPAGDRPALVSKTADPGGAGLALVQFAGPIKDAWLERLAKTGVRIVTYMAQNGYLVHGTGAQLETAGMLPGSDPDVRAVVRYTAADKVSDDLARDGVRRIEVQTLTGADGAAARAELAASADPLGPSATVGPFRTQFVRADVDEAAALAADPGVIAVLPSPEPELHGERQAQILAGNFSGTDPVVPTGPGYFNFHEGLGLGSATFGFTVDVIDSGVDVGTVATNHPDLHEGGVLANSSRIAYANNYTTDATANDCVGHGTIDAGIIGGFNTQIGTAAEDAEGFNYGAGIAPRVKVGNSKIFNCSAVFGNPNLTTVASTAYNAGARISNNSWGANVGGAYTANSQIYDALVRDAVPATPGNQEMVEIISAGNAGLSANTIGAPATAKNVITVGASESVHASGTDGCAVDNAGADDAHDIINFSSRGPTDDGRVKPDLVGPGTHITGTAPQHAAYTGTGVCTQFFPAAQTLYSLSSGTSHSAPAISGIAALLREWYRITVGAGAATPSPAMTKAILAQSSDDLLGGVGVNGNVPNQHQGWGRANISKALGSTPRVYRDQQDILGASGDQFGRTFTVQNTGAPVRVSLAWTDSVGPTTGNAFVNDLDLAVSAGAGTFKGNVFSGGLSATGGSADPANNLEQVYLPAGTSGGFTVTVRAQNIAGDGVPGNADTTDQDFALVVSNAAQVTAPVIAAGPRVLTPATPADGDNDLEPGERFTISQELRNVGNLGATSVAGALATTGPATLPDPTASWPNLAVGAAAQNSDPLSFRLNGTASCGQPLDLALAITTNEGAAANLPITVPTGSVGAGVVRSSADVPKSIPDATPAGVNSTLTVPPEEPGFIRDVNVRIGSLTHTFDGDLIISLTSPAGTKVTLANRVGGAGDNFTNTVFDDEAAAVIGTGNAAPFTGTFRPNGDQLSRFDGQNQVGVWTLNVADVAGADTGTLTSWGTDIAPSVCDFVADTTAPETFIDSGPAEGSTITTNAATFEFHGTPGDTAKVQCRIDGAPFADCTSPHTFSGLGETSHTAHFRAEDSSGNQDPDPATRTFTVDLSGGPPPGPDPPGPDGDGDGVPDSFDACPAQPGPASNNGCPVTQPPDCDAEQAAVDAAETALATALAKLKKAKAKLRAAKESGDADAIAKAKARVKKKKAKKKKATQALAAAEEALARCLQSA